jgi:adenylate cyclase
MVPLPGGALPLAEDGYRSLLEHIPAVTYLTSTEDPPRVLYVSPQASTMLGHSPERWLAVERYWLNEVVHPDDRAAVEAASSESDATGTYQCVYRIVTGDDRLIWVLDHASLVRDPGGGPLFWQGVMFDITAQKESTASGTEEALRRSEARYRALVEDIPAVIYEMGMDDERRTLYVSPHVEQVLGYSREEWLEQPDIWMELLHPDDREIELAAHDLHGETGEPWGREYRLIAAAGHFVWVRDQAVLVRDEDGRPLFWQGVMLDVTEQKELEEELRRVNDELEFRVLARTAELAEANEMMSLEIGERRRVEEQLRDAEERYRHIVENVPAVVYSWEIPGDDETPRRDYVSPQIEMLLGYSPQEWVDGELWNDRVHPHDYDAAFEATDRSRTTGEPFSMEYRYLARDGHVVWVLDQATLIARDRAGQPKMFQGVVLDITARKEAEAKAAEAEARYRQLAEGGSVIAYMLDRASGAEPHAVTYISPQIERILGYTARQWLDETGLWDRSLHPDDRERMREISRAVDSGRPWSADYRLIARDGRVVWLHDEGGPASFDEHGPATFHGVLLDITDRKEAEAQLIEAEERFRSLVEGMPAVPWTEVVDKGTGRSRITYIGPQAVQMFGYAPEDLVAEPDHFERLVHPDDRERMMARAAHCDETGEPWDEVFRVRARDGHAVWVRSRAQLVSDSDGRRVWQGVTVDITAEMGDQADPAVDRDGVPRERLPRH